MSIFDPKTIWAVVGVCLFLIALYLVLENAGGASSVLSTLFAGTSQTFGILQGRNVTTGRVSVQTAK
jgi:hypothetical protein